MIEAHFLQDEPSPAPLLQAVASNHRWWMIRTARAAGGTICRADGLIWIYTPGPAAEVVIPFPMFGDGHTSEQLDTILQYCRRMRPLQHVACWALHPATHPPDLGARLVARGFEWGWQPHWMWLDLAKMQADKPVPHGLHIGLVDGRANWDVDDLPYYSRATADQLYVLAHQHPRRVWHFAAWLDGHVVGHSVLNLTTGRHGVAGIYTVGVVPAARNRGIGTAVTVAACQLARQMGGRYAILNATGEGEPVYRRIGFQTLGYGQTWWLHKETLDAPPPTAWQVAFAEAMGRGDVAALSWLAEQTPPATLNAPLPSKMTPLELAVKTGQPAAAEWLVAHGAELDLIAAWDLGWKERVPRLIAASPQLVNKRSGAMQTTPLHEAVVRNDLELARAVLAANPDLSIEDAVFHSTALGWARHFGRTELIELIEQHRGGTYRSSRGI